MAPAGLKPSVYSEIFVHEKNAAPKGYILYCSYEQLMQLYSHAMFSLKEKITEKHALHLHNIFDLPDLLCPWPP